MSGFELLINCKFVWRGGGGGGGGGWEVERNTYVQLCSKLRIYEFMHSIIKI